MRVRDFSVILSRTFIYQILFQRGPFLKKTFALILKHLTEIISCYEYILTFKLQWGSMYVILTLSIYTI